MSKRKYSKLVLTFVIDGRNKIMKESKTSGVQEFIDTALKGYLAVGSQKLMPSRVELTPPDCKDIEKMYTESRH